MDMRLARCPPTSNRKVSIFRFMNAKHAESGCAGKVGRQFRTALAASILAATLAILYNLTVNSIQSLRRRYNLTSISPYDPISGIHDIDLGVENPDFAGLSPTPNPALHCFHVTGHETSHRTALQFNARTACFLRTVCLTPRTSASGGASLFVESHVTDGNATCTHLTPGYRVQSGASDEGATLRCDAIWRSTRCAQGHYAAGGGDLPPRCAAVRPLAEASYKAEWLPGLSVILPSYRYLQDHLHFAQAILPAVQTVASVGKLFHMWREGHFPREINLILRAAAPDDFGAWQQSFIEALLYFRLKKLGFSTTILTTFEDDWFQMDADTFWKDAPRKAAPFCTHSAILLGDIQDLTAWPFVGGLVADSWPFNKANGTVSYASNSSVPVESIIIRKAVYSYTAANTVIPDNILDITSGSDAPPTLLLDLPPRLILYARRNLGSDPKPGEFVSKGPTRRFSDADEKWFLEMLQSTAKASNFTMEVLHMATFDKFGDRVHKNRNAGVIAGINGPNLVETMFAPAFSVLLEVAPHQLRSYINGGNAGLAYMSYKPVKDATVQQSACSPTMKDCQDKSNRRVMIDDPRDRASLSAALRHAVQHVEKLHSQFGHLKGIPVKLDKQSARYAIDWSAAKNAKR